MYSGTTTLVNFDLRQKQSNDDALQRQIMIRNLGRAAVEGQALWQDKQQKLYTNLIPVGNPSPTLGQIITNEIAGSSILYINCCLLM